MIRTKNDILSKITTLKINSNSKLCLKKNSQKYITPRHTALLKNPISSNTSSKIKVNILNNEENINSNNIQKGIRKSKSRPKLIKKNSNKNILNSNKSFHDKTVKNKNKKNEINFNTSINTFFTTQNECSNYTNFNTEIKDINVNTKTKRGKSKTIKKRKSFGYGKGTFSMESINSNTNTNDFNIKTNSTMLNNNKIIKKTKSNASIKINLNKNINSSLNNINIKTLAKKVENNKINDAEKGIFIQKNKIRQSKSAKKLVIKKNLNETNKKLSIKEKKNNNSKSKISLERHSTNEFNIKINLKTNQVLSPIKKKNSNINNNNNNSEYKKNNSLNLFNNNNNAEQKAKVKTINSKNNTNKKHKKIIKNDSNKINKNSKNIGRKTTNNRPSKLLSKIDKNNSKKFIDINKSSNNVKKNNNNKKINNIIKTNDVRVNKQNNKEKEKISEFLIKDKSDKENINLLNTSPKTSRLKESNKTNINKKTKSHGQISIVKTESKSFEFDDMEKTSLSKNDLCQKNYDKIIINFEDLIELDSKLNSIISSLSSIFNSENEKEETSNECSEFFSFYFHCSLNNIFSNFFSKKNRIIINSGNNLLLFSIVVLYHLSLNQKMLNDLLDDMKYIFSLLKINFFLLVKKIEYYYQDDFPIYCTDLFNQKFVQYNSINCSNEIDLISKINKNCCSITERMKLVLNYYDRNNDTHYDEFSGLFKNLSTLTEKDINSYFFSYLYINPFNSEKNKINDVNNINISYTNKNTIPKICTKSINSSNNYSINSDLDSDTYIKDNISCKSEKSDNERELLSVKSYKSSNYFGKLKSDNMPNSTTINCDSNFYYNIENNIYENDEDGTNAYEIMKMIKEYEINKASSPFILTQTKKRYTLILDLDETLIHLRQKKQVVNIKNDVDININNMSDYNYNLDKNKNKYLLQFRIGLFSFLTLLKPFYEIISFTSATREYADVIINEIEKKRNFFDYKFYREHCVIYKDTFVKDISRIGRDIQKIIIVDNNENNFVLNKENGIKISPYYGDDEENNNLRLSSNDKKRNDNALIELKKILIKIYKDNYDDIREALKDYEELIKNKVSS